MTDEEVVHQMFASGVCRFDKYDRRTAIMHLGTASLHLGAGPVVRTVRRLRRELNLALMLDAEVVPHLSGIVGDRRPDRVFREMRVDWQECSPRLERLRARLRGHPASAIRIDARACRPGEDPEVTALLEEYLTGSGHTFFFFPGSAFDPADYGHYLIAHDATGRPFGLCKLSKDGQSLFGEILYARGGARANIAFVVEGLALVRDSLIQEVAVIASVEAVATMLRDMGFALTRTVHVHLLPRAAADSTVTQPTL